MKKNLAVRASTQEHNKEVLELFSKITGKRTHLVGRCSANKEGKMMDYYIIDDSGNIDFVHEYYLKDVTILTLLELKNLVNELGGTINSILI